MRRTEETEPIPLASRAKRLKSLNEFVPPYWLGLFKARKKATPTLLPAILVGLAIGAALGLVLIL